MQSALFILGRSGSGKSSLAKLLSEQFGLFLISGGELLRQLSTSQSSPDGGIAGDVIAGGVGAPDELVVRLYREFIEDYRPSSVVFDGNPKNVEQCMRILDLLFEVGTECIFAVELNVPFDVCESRVTRRRRCCSCGATWVDTDIACTCSGALSIREDDTDSGARQGKRDWYETGVEQVLGYFDEHLTLLRLDGQVDSCVLVSATAEWMTSAQAIAQERTQRLRAQYSEMHVVYRHRTDE